MQEIHSVSIGFITAASGRSSGGRRDERKVPSHPQVSQARPPPSCIQPLPRMKSFQLSSIEEAGDLSAYDCVFLGFWIEGGMACEEAENVLRHLTNRHIFLFATLAADPESAHAIACKMPKTFSPRTVSRKEPSSAGEPYRKRRYGKCLKNIHSEIRRRES